MTLTLTVVLRHGAEIDHEADETRPSDFDELAEDAVYPLPGAPAA